MQKSRKQNQENNTMKTNRIIRNFLELLLLCGTTFLLVWALSKKTASHDHGILGFLLITYGITILVNFILQTLLLLNSDKTERRYWFAKIKLFALLLVLSVVVDTLIIAFIGSGLKEAFFFFFPFSVAVFVLYIGIIFILSLFDNFLQRYRIWISQKRNRTIQYAIIAALLIIVATCTLVSLLNARGKNLENTLFRKALLSKSQEDVDLYLKTYPSGKFKKPLKLMLKSESGKFIDERDGKEYAWVKIGEQIWMAENLNYETPESRCYDIIGSHCYEEYSQDCEKYCEKYGRLYPWSEAQNACPEGWKLPSDEDWEILKEYTKWITGKDKVDENYLLLQTENGWEHSNGNNATGFSAIPTVGFYNSTDFTTWWSSSERKAEHYCIWVWTMGAKHFFSQADTKTAFHSIRCIKNDRR
ncbi:MAG: hypothetical protein LBR55_04825 [Bacteroidales bacterium]|jgi:uncharacterized protein (TIGR02145 family)|nr:hypothetical protein [Bacteroidales bacterium]